MAASSILTLLDSALDDMELRINRNPFLAQVLKKHRIILRNLKAFVLCSRKLLVNHADLGSLLVKIENAVGRYAKEIHRLCDARNTVVLMPRLRLIVDEILSFEKEIDQWRITLSDLTRGSNCLRADEIVGITDSVLGNTVDFPMILKCQSSQLVSLTSTMEVLGVQLTFLKDFLRFAIRTSVDHRHVEDLLTHFEAVTVDAASLFVQDSVIDESDEKWSEEIQLKCSIFLQKIRPVDPQVCQTYTQALSSSKPTGDMDDGSSMIVMKNLLDSLISLLWDVLRLDTCHNLDFIKDHRQVLFEGLRFLRTIMKKQQPGAGNFDEKIRVQIEILVCDAGVFVFSFFQTCVEVNSGLEDLCERIALFQSKLEGDVQQKLIFNCPSMNEVEFVDSLLDSLMELTNSNVEPTPKTLAETIVDELKFLRSFLKETEEVRNEKEQLQILWNRVLKLAYRVEFFIDRLGTGDILDSITVLFASIIEESRDIKTALSNITYKDMKAKKGDTLGPQPPLSQHPGGPPSMTNEFVGFHAEAESIIDDLTSGKRWLRLFAIYGMPGAGKTTLVSKVYNDPFVTSYFPVRAWCSLTRVFDKQLILRGLLNQISPEIDSKMMSEEDLEMEVLIGLESRRYLIVLDDIWNIEAWNKLKHLFPNRIKGSRILLTSQILGVVPADIIHGTPYFLRQFTEDESLELLQRKLFHGNDCPASWTQLGKKIAALCKGLPLTIVTVADLLSTMEQERWEEILGSEILCSGTLSSTEQFMNTLELSYENLPNGLKACFLYFGAFPEDEEISVKRLIRLWIAEGFVPITMQRRFKEEISRRSLISQSMPEGTSFGVMVEREEEDFALEYLEELIGRGLVMIAKTRFYGDVKTCRMHTLLHQFCLIKLEKVNFIHLLKEHHQLSDFNEPNYFRKLCIGYDGDHSIKESKLFCPRTRSLLFFPPSEKKLQYERYWHATSFIITILKFLKVLDLEQIHVGDVFPSEIQLLLLLKYLAIQGNMTVIPSFIGNLSNLQTFVVNLDRVNGKVSLPHTIWNLQKLKWLSINFGGGILPIENLEKSSALFQLLSFSGAVFQSFASMEQQLEKFPNIRKLKCDLSGLFAETEKFSQIVIPKFLSQLQSLHLWRSDLVVMNQVIFDFVLPENLKKLTLSRFALPWTKISNIGKLPNLVILKLLDSCFIGDTWDVEEGSFLKLKFLQLSKLNIVRWKASEDEFQHLEKLVLDHCSHLEEMPSCLKHCDRLNSIEVSNCFGTVANLVKKLVEQRSDYAISDLKVLIQSSWEAFEPL